MHVRITVGMGGGGQDTNINFQTSVPLTFRNQPDLLVSVRTCKLAAG